MPISISGTREKWAVLSEKAKKRKQKKENHRETEEKAETNR